MAHVRDQIVDAVIAALKGETAAGAKVQKFDFNIDDADRPLILVVYGDETSEGESDDELDRELPLGCIVVADGSSAIDDAGDIAAKIEELIGGDAALLGGLLCRNDGLVATSPDVDVDGSKLIFSLTMTFAFVYQTAKTDATVAIG